jgi:hypothetical protein
MSLSAMTQQRHRPIRSSSRGEGEHEVGHSDLGARDIVLEKSM